MEKVVCQKTDPSNKATVYFKAKIIMEFTLLLFINYFNVFYWVGLQSRALKPFYQRLHLSLTYQAWNMIHRMNMIC